MDRKTAHLYQVCRFVGIGLCEVRSNAQRQLIIGLFGILRVISFVAGASAPFDNTPSCDLAMLDYFSAAFMPMP